MEGLGVANEREFVRGARVGGVLGRLGRGGDGSCVMAGAYVEKG